MWVLHDLRDTIYYVLWSYEITRLLLSCDHDDQYVHTQCMATNIICEAVYWKDDSHMHLICYDAWRGYEWWKYEHVLSKCAYMKVNPIDDPLNIGTKFHLDTLTVLDTSCSVPLCHLDSFCWHVKSMCGKLNNSAWKT